MSMNDHRATMRPKVALRAAASRQAMGLCQTARGAHFHGQRGAGPQHNWYRGARIPPPYRGGHYVVNDWRMHRLDSSTGVLIYNARFARFGWWCTQWQNG